MLPFDAVFLIPFAIITLSLTLYFTLLMKLKPSTEVKLSTYLESSLENNQDKKSLKKNRVSSKAAKNHEPTTRIAVEEKECPHYVGYLTTLPKGSGFPDECFGCRKVIQCLRIEPTKVIESFYLTATETE